MWDFQLCTLAVDPIGFSAKSMFPTRKGTYAALTEYCQGCYGKEVKSRPYALVAEWHFDDLAESGASRILFTNGMQVRSKQMPKFLYLPSSCGLAALTWKI
jgi:hypothetical protein